MKQLSENSDVIIFLFALVGVILVVASLRIILRDYVKLIRGEDRRKPSMFHNFPIIDGNGMLISEDRRKSHDRRKYNNAI